MCQGLPSSSLSRGKSSYILIITMLSDNKSCVKAREGSVEALFSQTCVLFVEEQRRALGTFYMNALTLSGFEDNFGNM